MSTADLKVLIIDTTQSIRISSKPILVKEMGFSAENILESNNGRRALDLLQTEEIDLVLCEWDIPEISGIELLKFVRSSNNCHSTEFVFVTSNSDQHNILEAVNCKVSQYIVKPFSTDSFIGKINAALGSKNRRVHKRHSVKSEHDLTVMRADKLLTTGKMINLSKSGVLAKLALFRSITVTDVFDLKISVFGRSGKQYFNTIQAELVRIEKLKETTEKNFVLYAFVFEEMDMVQKNFIDRIIETRDE
ncbi:MAG: response regulator [Proteobacteria bacterium]|nr:response regulator [Pseudomonadota bacterium]MBU1736628.1 response regulator [Pseudomonadota bacterium]